MASKYIDTHSYASSGYTLSGVFQSITIGPAGSIGGPGIIGGTKESYTIVNRGSITGTNTAISLADGGTVGNTGRIRATAGAGIGISIAGAGLVTNTGTGLIEGDFGVAMASGYVGNAGTIIGSGTKAIGVDLTTGTVTNLGGGLIEGNLYGVAITGSGGLLNSASGTITALSVGVQLAAGSGTNDGVIEGKIGIRGVNGGTVTNDGTIESTAGATGIAVDFTFKHDTFVDEAGSVTVGTIVGDGGTLALAGATGTLSGLGTNFSGFGTVNLAVGADWVASGSNTVSGGFNIAGTLDLFGTLGGTGTLALAGNETLAPAKLTVADLTVTAGIATLGGNLTYTGISTESGGTVSLATHILALKGAASFTGGTVDGSGNLQTFGATTLGRLTLDGGATWQDYGTVTETGTLTMGDSSGGAARLVVEAGGTLNLEGSGCRINPNPGYGSGSAIVNLSVIEGTGGSVFEGPAVNNSGEIVVTDGNLDFSGRITGTGSSTIESTGTLIFNGSVANTQTAAFASTSGGQLVLTFPDAYRATIYGFGGSDRIVVAEDYDGTQPLWTQIGSTGTLTISEGSLSASIVLFGQYTSANFMASDLELNGGTTITYVPTSNQRVQLAPPHH